MSVSSGVWKGFMWVWFFEWCIAGVSDGIFLGRVNGCELRASDGDFLGNIEWTPAG